MRQLEHVIYRAVHFRCNMPSGVVGRHLVRDRGRVMKVEIWEDCVSYTCRRRKIRRRCVMIENPMLHNHTHMNLARVPRHLDFSEGVSCTRSSPIVCRIEGYRDRCNNDMDEKSTKIILPDPDRHTPHDTWHVNIISRATNLTSPRTYQWSFVWIEWACPIFDEIDFPHLSKMVWSLVAFETRLHLHSPSCSCSWLHDSCIYHCIFCICPLRCGSLTRSEDEAISSRQIDESISIYNFFPPNWRVDFFST